MTRGVRGAIRVVASLGAAASIGLGAAAPAGPRADAAFHNWVGVEQHLQRRLDDAARAYVDARDGKPADG